MNRQRITQTAMAVVACASIAALVGVASGAAAPSGGNGDTSSPRSGPFALPGGPPPGDGAGIMLRARTNGRRAGPGPGGPVMLGGPVHSELVVPTSSGNDFETITQDSGKVDSVSGSQLTVTEGTEQATYKTVTLDIPDDATVIRNGKQAALTDLQQGDHVHVSLPPQHSFVFAADDSFAKRLRNHALPPRGIPGPPPGLPALPPTGRRGH